MIYVMSDIHGNMRRFRSVMEQINLQPKDTLYVLGDVIDRFPYGITILQELMSMPNVKMLLGNHEYMMLTALDPDYAESGPYTENYREALHLWYDNRGRMTKRELDKLDRQAREGIFAYLRGLPLSYEITVGEQAYRLIHAAPLELYPEYKWNYLTETMFTVWYRWPLRETIDADCTVIFGHTPTYDFNPFVSPMVIYHGEKRIGIDCGSGFPANARNYGVPNGRLACLRLDDMKEFYSKEFLDDYDTEYTDEQVEAFWAQFVNVPMDPELQRIEDEFLWFTIGTHKKEILRWFDRHHSKGVAYLRKYENGKDTNTEMEATPK